MKKLMLFAMVASLLFFAGCEKEKDFPSGSGLFSVSEGKQVRFASGNLEYDNINGYRFAAHQYDYGGYFGWGTGSNPTNISGAYVDYPTFDDWGNHIAGGWRTLTQDEWQYVIWDRTDAAAKRGAATVCGVYGMVLLPDNFSGGTFTAGFNGYSANVYDASSWSGMEDSGAVFLPAAGARLCAEVEDVGAYIGAYGIYWLSTPYDVDCAYVMAFYEYGVDDKGGSPRGFGCSVRLVQDY